MIKNFLVMRMLKLSKESDLLGDGIGYIPGRDKFRIQESNI